MTKTELAQFLEAQGAPEHVKRHCLAAGDVAVNVAAALTAAGFVKADGAPLDMDVVRTAAYLHDVARAGKDHDVVGAEIVRPLNEAAGEAVRRHMKLIFPEKIADVTEAEIVSLGDRTVREDRYVGYEARMDDLLMRYGDVPEVVARVRKNMDLALGLIAQIEETCGRPFAEIAAGGTVDVAPLLRRVERPGRYIGGEVGAAQKDWNEPDAVRFCFAFPDLYEIGMSYTGLQILYGLLNAADGVLCERTFAPALDMQALMKEEGVPLFSLETRHAVRDFDLVGFTLQYELCYTNVIRMLDLAGIPVHAAERGEGDPVVVCGGPCCANPLPMAPFADLFVIGDGEEVAVRLCEAFRASERRDDFLRRAAEMDGVILSKAILPDSRGVGRQDAAPTVEDGGTIVMRAVVADLDAAFFPVRPVVPHIEAVHERAAVEIMRGCYRACRFCQAGHACAGVRRRSPEKIKELLLAQLAHTGYDEASLLSLSTGDYPGIEGLVTELMDVLAPMDVALSLPSLRLDSLN
ncbi:MAG: HD domain-containing protein, partial [Clostridiales Family XIII bacterium]|nr:HD domain-containing protein [Clostridiales Family XIII bacterium]